MSSLNPLENYGLVAYLPVKEELTRSVFFNTMVNILRLRATDRNEKAYSIAQVKEPYERVYIYSQTHFQTAVEFKLLLGYDTKYDVWFTKMKDSKKVKALLSAMTPLTKRELAKVNPQAAPQIEAVQERVIEALKTLEFIPPIFGFQLISPQEFAQLPCDPLPGQVKSNIDLSHASLSTPDDFFSSLLLNNKGIFFGYGYDDLEKGLSDFMVTHMEILHASGVRHLYDEMPAAANYNAFAEFNNDPNDNGDKIASILKDDIKTPYFSGKMKIYRAAKKAGIQVWLIDSTIPKENNDLNYRLQTCGKIMVRNISYFASKLKEGERFITMNGMAFHDQIANGLAIPYVQLKIDLDDFMDAALTIRNQSNSSSSSGMAQASQAELVKNKNRAYFQQMPRNAIEAMLNPDFTISLTPTLTFIEKRPS